MKTVVQFLSVAMVASLCTNCGSGQTADTSSSDISGESGAKMSKVARENTVQSAVETNQTAEDLTFAGHDLPFIVEFVGLESDPAFPGSMMKDVVIRVTNHTNKDAVHLRLNVFYLNEDGQSIDEFGEVRENKSQMPPGHGGSPMSLSGTHSFEGISYSGQVPVVAKESTQEIRRMAPPLMPNETKNLRMNVTGAKFADGSVWDVLLD